MRGNQITQCAPKALHQLKNGSHEFWSNGWRSSPSPQEQQCYRYTQKFFLETVRLKWVKHRGLDHIIDKEMDLKAVCMLKDIIKKHPGGCLPVSSVSNKQRELGLTIQVLRFLRRYPTIFQEFVGAKYNVPWFRLTPECLDLDQEEQRIHKEHAAETAQRLCKLLMMTNGKKLPLQSIDPLKWDLGLAGDYVQTLVPKFSEYFSIVKLPNNRLGLNLQGWNEEFAISALQKKAEAGNDTSYRDFKKRVPLAYEMNYPRGYGLRKKVISWMEEWQRLPYISPYEDSSNIDPNSDLMEKRVVGVFHELLNLTIHKKTERNNLRCLREEMNLPHRFTRIFTRYPGIFYLSLKCSTTTVALREGYKSGQLVEKHPLASVREKYFYMMRMGILYRNKGVDKINPVRAQGTQEWEPNKFPDKDDGRIDRGSDQEEFPCQRFPTERGDFGNSMYAGRDCSEVDVKEFLQGNDDEDGGRGFEASGQKGGRGFEASGQKANRKQSWV